MGIYGVKRDFCWKPFSCLINGDGHRLKMQVLFENILIMILTIVVLLAGAYLVLAVLGWGLKIKSGSREQEGLTDLWIANQADANRDPAEFDKPDDGD